MHLRVDTREDDVDTFIVAHLHEVLQVVHSGGIDERHLTHSYDPHLRATGHTTHNLLEAVGNAEEEGAVDLIHLAAVGNLEVLQVGSLEIHFLGRVDLVGEDADLRGLSHTAHTEQAGQHEAHLDGYGEVEDNGEEEGDEQHGDVRLGILQ